MFHPLLSISGVIVSALSLFILKPRADALARSSNQHPTPFLTFFIPADDNRRQQYCHLEGGSMNEAVSSARQRRRALWISAGSCLFFAVAGNLLVGEPLSNWYAALQKPWFLIPIWLFVLVGLLYYGLMGVILYRIQRAVEPPANRPVVLGIGLVVMALNELWNYLFFGLQSTFYGFIGMVGFWVVVTGWLVLLWRRERRAAQLLLLYWLWVIYDIAWTYALWWLNG